MKFLWTENIDMPAFPTLRGEHSADVLVIGGGMAGVLCAYFLQREGADCVLAEARTIGRGVTRGTTAVLSAQHDILYSDLIAHAGAERARQYLNANLRAVEQFRVMAAEVSCDFEEKPAVLYSLDSAEKMRAEAEAINALGAPAEFVQKISLPFLVAGGIRLPGQAQFHPLKFLAAVSKDLHIYENTFVTRLEGHTAYTSEGKIKAGRVIVASHFPFLNSHGLYFAKLYQERSRVIAMETGGALPETYSQYGGEGMFFRSYGNLLLIGGCNRRTGKKSGFESLRGFALRHYPGSEEKYAWATQDCMSLDGVPYIGRYSPALPHVFTATGFNGWGMTTSMAAARILTDLTLGRESEFAAVFSPDRSMLKKQLLVNLGETAGNFVLPKIRRCPHMGCTLAWNEAEQSWDCPCHGSRFDRTGKLIDNPAMRDARVR